MSAIGRQKNTSCGRLMNGRVGGMALGRLPRESEAVVFDSLARQSQASVRSLTRRVPLKRRDERPTRAAPRIDGIVRGEWRTRAQLNESNAAVTRVRCDCALVGPSAQVRYDQESTRTSTLRAEAAAWRALTAASVVSAACTASRAACEGRRGASTKSTKHTKRETKAS